MTSNNVTVIGLQWGDEGKGKIIDALARKSRYVVRFCGGANAGHTVVVGSEKFALHLIPCGMLHKGVMNVIGNGVAFDPAVAIEEIDSLSSRGIAVGPENMRISAAAQTVMPWHKLQDALSETALGGSKIGTTNRGIGPCYSDKANRSTAIRVGELLDEKTLRPKIAKIVELKNHIFAALYDAKPMDAKKIADEFVGYGRRLGPMICNTGALLRKADAAGERIFFEGGQGSMLDIDHGTFPFVTSSSVTACGVPVGTGVPPSSVGHVIGLIKAYTSRVGSGPFPTEQDNEIGNIIRERGHEYGSTTGRPRRCGWFDAFAVKYAADISGVNELALSLLDVLSGQKEIKICTGYKVGGKMLEDYDPTVLAEAQCVYETMPGWEQDLTACKSFDDLPPQARAYVERVERLIGRPVGFISVGPQRSHTIIHNTQVRGLDK